MSEHELLAKIKQKDEAALEELVKRYERRTFGIAYGILGNAEDAKDAAQDAFLRVWEKIGEFDERSAFSTWLYRIVTNLCIDKKRKMQKWKIFSLVREEEDEGIERQIKSPSPLPDETLLSGELDEKIKEALGKLPVQQRAVFTLRHFEGISTKETSEILKISEGAVKTHLARAVTKLKEMLTPYVNYTK